MGEEEGGGCDLADRQDNKRLFWWSTVCSPLGARACAANHPRFISSVTTSQTNWHAIMLYQQINDSAITCHNWLWHKGCDILSVYAAAAALSALCHFYYWKTLLTPCLPLSRNSPLPPPLPLSTSPERGPLLLLAFYLWEQGIGKTDCVSAILHHIQSCPPSIPMFIQLSALSNVLPPPFPTPLFPPQLPILSASDGSIS